MEGSVLIETYLKVCYFRNILDGTMYAIVNASYIVSFLMEILQNRMITIPRFIGHTPVAVLSMANTSVYEDSCFMHQIKSDYLLAYWMLLVLTKSIS